MSDTTDMPHSEQDNVNLSQSSADSILDWSQFYDMFMNIEQRLPNFDHMLMAMNDYAFQRTSRQRQTNDLNEFYGVIKKGLIDWYTNSIENKINRTPDFIDLTNHVFGDDIMQVDKKLVSTTSPKTETNKITDTSGNADASKSTNTSANNTDANESTSTSANNTDANENTNTSANTSANNTNANESTNTSANNTDANENTDIRANNTDANENTDISANNTDANESTNTSANNTDANESINTSGNTDACENTNLSANTSANNTDANENTNTSANNTDGIKSTATSPNEDPIDIEEAVAKLRDRLYAEEGINTKRASAHFFNRLNIAKHLKYNYSHKDSMKASEMSKSTETNVDTEDSFKIIMPNMTKYNTIQRKRLPIDSNIHLGNDYERHWWRQTNDKIILYVDISDLIFELVPNIKVEVTIIGFKIKVKRSNKWVVILSNKFEKAIAKTKWVVNKYKHVKLTINKKEKEFWSKCLVTETRELDTSNFKHHSCSNECNTPKPPKLEMLKTREECMEEFKTFINEECDDGDIDTFMKEINDIVPITTKKPQDSASTLNSSVDTSTVMSLESDSENPQSTQQFFMDSEFPLTLSD